MALEDLLDFEYFASNFFKIKDKNTGIISQFKINRAQRYLTHRLDSQLKSLGMVRAVILKGRQQGSSTLIQARYTHRIITTIGKKAFILTHQDDATKNLFDITKRYIDNLPHGLCPKPETRSATELSFKKFQSSYATATAGNKGAGRSQTIHLFHGSEIPLWPNADEHADGALEAVPRAPGTEIILESTAKGMGNYFHKMWLKAMSGESEYQAIFIPWYWQDEYSANTPGFEPTEEELELYQQHKSNGLTLNHLCWRRIKISEKVGETSGDIETRTEKFQQEYPMTAAEAFRNSTDNAFIHSKWVMRARKADVESDSGLIIGVDPALGDKDKFAIIRRRGRLAYGLERHINYNAMQIVGLIRKIIEREKPVKVYIDVIGIGAGIVSRLLELGFDMVEGINVSREASEKKKFRNKRAELWAEMKAWFMGESPVQVPDSDILQTDLCNLGAWFTSDGRLQMEGKDSLKTRGLDSPDSGDALALTFSGGFYEISHGEFEERVTRMNTKGKFY